MEALGVIVLFTRIISYAIWFIFIFLLITFITRNRPNLKKSTFFSMIALGLFMGIWINLGILQYYTDSSIIPVFSYSIAPYIYNAITQFVIPGVLIFLAVFALTKNAGYKALVIVSILTTICTLPWQKLSQIIKPEDYSVSTTKYVSKKESDEMGANITSTVTGEEIVYIPKYNSKVLRIKTRITVPRSGLYSIPQFIDINSKFEDMLLPTKPSAYNFGERFYGFNYELHGYNFVYINDIYNSYDDGVLFNEGTNEVLFDFPFVVLESNEKKINRFFIDGVKGIYGPYTFRFMITGLKTDQGDIHFRYYSDSYSTQVYKVDDLK